MAEKIKKEVNTQTVVKCKDLEIKEGSLDSPIWIMEVDGKLKIVVEPEVYLKMLNEMDELLKEILDLQLEKAILSELPIDYEDVRAVVLKELKKNPNKNIVDILHQIKLENSNLFYNIDLDFDKEF